MLQPISFSIEKVQAKLKQLSLGQERALSVGPLGDQRQHSISRTLTFCSNQGLFFLAVSHQSNDQIQQHLYRVYRALKLCQISSESECPLKSYSCSNLLIGSKSGRKINFFAITRQQVRLSKRNQYNHIGPMKH